MTYGDRRTSWMQQLRHVVHSPVAMELKTYERCVVLGRLVPIPNHLLICDHYPCFGHRLKPTPKEQYL